MQSVSRSWNAVGWIVIQLNYAAESRPGLRRLSCRARVRDSLRSRLRPRDPAR